MVYLVAGRTIVIETFDEWAHQAVSDVFSGWFFKVVSPEINANPNATIRIHCGGDQPHIPPHLSRFEITCDGTCFTNETFYFLKFEQALVRFSAFNTAVDFWIAETYDRSSSTFTQLLSQALAPALRRAGLFEVHSGGAISPETQSAIMIAGPSGSGKSTLTTQLADLGWAYLSDDILLLTEVAEELQLQAFRRCFALSSETIAAVGLPAMQGTQIQFKQRLIPQDHFNHAPVEQSKPRAIVFPRVMRQEESQVKSLTSAETMSRLLRLCPWASYDKGTSLEHLHMLGRLATSTSGFELFAGTDILNDSQLTEQIFIDISRKIY
jgi:hypothetical protein